MTVEPAAGTREPSGTGARLRVAGLTKRYGAVTALSDLSFTLAPHQFVGLLGPNGAGKSTLFQVLTGLFAADAGDVEVAGLSMRRQPWKALAQIGVVFQQPSLDLDLSVQRNLRFQAGLHGLAPAVADARVGPLCEALGIGADLQRPVRELSGGNRRKVELVRALLHQPSLLLMDEATVGLDPKSRRDLLAAIRREVDEHGTTVLWATHWVEEAEQADRVMVLHKGRLLAHGTPQDVTRELGGATLEQGFIQCTTRPETPRPEPR